MVSMSEQSASIVWFDLVERLGEIERERLIEAGLRPLPVRNIAEAVTLAPSVDRVVVRPVDDTAVIAELRKRLTQSAAQMAAVEIAATGAAMPPRAEPATTPQQG